MANATGRCIIALEKATAEIPFQNDVERDAFLEQLADTFPKRLHQSWLTWSNNRVVKERERANSPTPEPDDVTDQPDGLQKHKEQYAAEREARKTFG